MTNSHLHREHLSLLDHFLVDALARAAKKGLALNGVLFHAGRAMAYHSDDQDVPFRPTPHFLRYVPLEGAEHCVLARPGQRPLVVRVAPKDYWYETAPVAASYWQANVDFVEATSYAEAVKALGPLAGIAYVGPSAEAAAEAGIPAELVEPTALMAPLDWSRATKTAHEIALIEVAAQRAADGHRVARKAFEAGASEREIHWAYLEATGLLERELAFETIIAIDEKTATLHYHNKRATIPTPRHTFMLDAGATCDGYGSDITRTWFSGVADPVFRALILGVDELEQELVKMVTPGRPYPEIHVAAHRKIAELLVKTGVVRASAEECFARGVTRTFLPHGVGHHLGLQVHDVGGRQADPDGGLAPPPPEFPSLRNTRVLEPGHVVTIEPGLYFIPMLLEQLQADAAASLVDWDLVRRLTPSGGIRIEDDVLCTPTGPRDLTRPLIQGPRGI